MIAKYLFLLSQQSIKNTKPDWALATCVQLYTNGRLHEHTSIVSL